jgi:hypothetical protein
LIDSADHAAIRDRLTAALVSELYGDDLSWIEAGQLVGLPDDALSSPPDRGLSLQRGSHWPVPPQSR